VLESACLKISPDWNIMTKFKAAIFDWAGTTVDFGSFAPMGVFIKAMAAFGVDITVEEARAPMGAAKWDHIHALLQMPQIASQWVSKYGKDPTDADVNAIFKVFVPMNETVAADYADLIPGTLDTIADLRGRGMKIGSTTGYTRSIMQHVLPAAAAQGYPALMWSTHVVASKRPPCHAVPSTPEMQKVEASSPAVTRYSNREYAVKMVLRSKCRPVPRRETMGHDSNVKVQNVFSINDQLV
jgi:phosphonoacetaldehyde hydrolase